MQTHDHQIPTFDPALQRQVLPSNMVTVVNALDITVKFGVGGNPGNPEMIFTLPPGAQANVPKTFCDPIEGANPDVPRPSVLAMKTSVEPYPGGKAIQGVVPLADAQRTRAAWIAAKANQPRTATVMLHDNEGNPIPLGIPRAGVAASPAPAQQPAGDADLRQQVAHLTMLVSTLLAGQAPATGAVVAPVPSATPAAAPAADDEDDEIEPPPPGAPDLRVSSAPAPAPVLAASRGGKVVGESKADKAAAKAAAKGATS